MAVKQEYLRPHDVLVLLQLVITPGKTFRELAASVGLSLGEVHNAATRLQLARLVLLEQRSANLSAALDFIVCGVPYSFPARLGSLARGVATAFSAEPLSDMVLSDQAIVWADPKGDSRGFSVSPLSPSAAEVSRKNPELYRYLTLIDGLRVGQARERKMARSHLERAFHMVVNTTE